MCYMPKFNVVAPFLVQGGYRPPVDERQESETMPIKWERTVLG